MSLNTTQYNGSVVANMCYKEGERYRRIGSLVYFRTHKAELILEIIPMKAWVRGDEYFIGNFIPSEKVPEPPYLEGDIMASTDARGKPIQIGHLHTRDNAVGDTQYFMTLIGIPIGVWRKMIINSEDGNGRKPLYFQLKLEEDQ